MNSDYEYSQWRQARQKSTITVDLNTGQWRFVGAPPESLEQVQQWVDNVNKAMNQVFQPKNSGSKKD